MSLSEMIAALVGMVVGCVIGVLLLAYILLPALEGTL